MKPLPAVLAALLLSLPAYAAKPVGAPPSSPEEKAFFKGAHNSMRGSCCDEADGYREGISYPINGVNHVILQEWKPSHIEGEFEVKIIDRWLHVDKLHIVQCGADATDQNGRHMDDAGPCNPTGGAVVWLYYPTANFLGVVDVNSVPIIRCFAPGNLT